MGNIHSTLFVFFAKEYIPKLWGAVQNNIINSGEKQIRIFSKEIVDTLINSFDKLLKRVYSLGEKYEVNKIIILKF